MFPLVEDVKIDNEKHGNGFGEYNSSSPHLNGIQPSGAKGVVGDVVLYSEGSPRITFTQVADPETLSIVIKTLNPRQELSTQSESVTKEIEHLSCPKCDNKENPLGSKFCNNCGSALSPVCPKCDNPNPAEAMFCGQCGSKLN